MAVGLRLPGLGDWRLGSLADWMEGWDRTHDRWPVLNSPGAYGPLLVLNLIPNLPEPDSVSSPISSVQDVRLLVFSLSMTGHL